MRLFPTVHVTGALPPAQQAHLERHGLVMVGAQDDPDLVLVLPGTAPGPAGTGAGGVVLATGAEPPGAAGLLPPGGIAAPGGPGPPSSVVPADLPGDAPLAWPAARALPVCAPRAVAGPATPLLRTATGS